MSPDQALAATGGPGGPGGPGGLRGGSSAEAAQELVWLLPVRSQLPLGSLRTCWNMGLGHAILDVWPFASCPVPLSFNWDGEALAAGWV